MGESELLMPPGVTHFQAQRRLQLPTYFLPTITSDGANLSASSRTTQQTATASATPHTKGAWVEVTAALSAEIHVLEVQLGAATYTSATNTSTLCDVGVGAGGSEVVVVPNLAIGWQDAAINRFTYRLPLTIPAGSRVAVRIQSAVVSKTASIALNYYTMPHGRRPAQSIVAMGDNTAISAGVAIAGTTINTKSAWQEIISATTQPFGALFLGCQGGGDTNLLANWGIVDVGVGTAGNEIVIGGGDFPYLFTSAESVTPLGIYPIGRHIPMGTRLSVRWARDNAGNSLDAILYGAPLT